MIIVWGKVRQGQKRGKLLGFPTANFKLYKKIEQEVYISKTKVDGEIHKSITFIGNAKTFAEKDIKAETYILDFDKNIYDKYISVTLLKKIRGNKKFKSEKQLIQQMRNDLRITRQYFKT